MLQDGLIPIMLPPRRFGGVGGLGIHVELAKELPPLIASALA